MNQKIFYCIVLILATIATFSLMRKETPSIPTDVMPSRAKSMDPVSNISSPPPSATGTQSKQDEIDFESVLSPQEKKLLAEGYVLTPQEREMLLRKKRANDLRPTTEELKEMFDTRVEFYGQVLDQFGNPVVNAKITCSWPYMGPLVSPVRLVSAAPNAKFEILEIKAIAITVVVEPPQGYAQLPESKLRVQFANAPDRILRNEDYKAMTEEQKKLLAEMHGFGVPHKPDKEKPVIFRLKKL